MVQFTDRLTIDKSHRTKDGYLRVVAKGARSGIQQYLGREVDPEGKHFAADQVVNVYRPPEEVFDEAALASFVGKPITDDHPSVAVDAKNWRAHSRGVVARARQSPEAGQWVDFDMAFMDADLVGKVDAGKRELSAGYACDLAFEDGVAPDGTAYQAVQRTIRGNHVAVVDRARAGSDARISDGGNSLFENCDAATVILNLADDLKETKVAETLTLDGLKVDLSDAEAVKAAVNKLQGQLADAVKAKDAAEAQVATLTTEKSTLDAKVTTLEKRIADAKLTPQQLRDAAKAYQATVDKAKALGVTVSDEMDEAAIQKAVVDKHVGDAAKDWTADQIAVSFATIDAKVAKTSDVKPIHTPLIANDTAAIRDAARSLRR